MKVFSFSWLYFRQSQYKKKNSDLEIFTYMTSLQAWIDARLIQDSMEHVKKPSVRARFSTMFSSHFIMNIHNILGGIFCLCNTPLAVEENKMYSSYSCFDFISIFVFRRNLHEETLRY